MPTRTLDKATSDKVSFISFIIPRFAEMHKMGMKDAYLYLKKYGGLNFLMEHWWPLHCDNDIWAVYDIYDYCRLHGGEK